MKPHNFILLIPAAIIVSVFSNRNEGIFYGFMLGCAAAFATYFWWATRKAERDADKRFERWQAQHPPHDKQ